MTEKYEEIKKIICAVMLKELKEFQNNLLAKSKKEILTDSFEYSVKVDIVLAFDDVDDNNISIKLLENIVNLINDGDNNINILNSIYNIYIGRETEYMSDIRSCIEEYAKKISSKKQVDILVSEDNSTGMLFKDFDTFAEYMYNVYKEHKEQGKEFSIHID